LDKAAASYYDQDHIHSVQTINAFKAGAEWQKEQDKDKQFTYADIQAAFEAGKDYGDINARFWNTDGVSRSEYDSIEDFELWIKNYKP
jgi:hypothetical protein